MLELLETQPDLIIILMQVEIQFITTLVDLVVE